MTSIQKQLLFKLDNLIDIKDKKYKKVIEFLENAIIKNYFIDIVSIMRNFNINRKEFEMCFEFITNKQKSNINK